MVGVLALQGDYEAHERKLHALKKETLRVVSAEQLNKVASLVIPGGESSVFLKLLSPDLKAALVKRANEGMPILATCAGVILIAKGVENPKQESLGLIDIDVCRNAYGRQKDSFVSKDLKITSAGCKVLDTTPANLEGVFIRAPKITRVGKNVSTVVALDDEPVGVACKNILALTFHPELSEEVELPYHFLSHL
jgi:5'-phosphate synthase pdxT subunit